MKLLNTEEDDDDDLMVLKRKNYDPDDELVTMITYSELVEMN